MSADLRIMEGVIQSEVDSHNGRSERATQKAQDLPIKVDAGVATDIITDIMGTLDCSRSGFADKSKEFAENLEILLKNTRKAKTLPPSTSLKQRINSRKNRRHEFNFR